jgi:hypothetical protein
VEKLEQAGWRLCWQDELEMGATVVKQVDLERPTRR